VSGESFAMACISSSLCALSFSRGFLDYGAGTIEGSVS